MPATRQDVLRTLPKGSVGAEIGVMHGVFSRDILDIVQPKTLYLVDHWTSFREGGNSDEVRNSQDTNLHVAMCNVVSEVAQGVVRPLCTTSELAAPMIPDESLDWVYIDADHSYKNCRKDLDLWVPKVKHGGIIAGHDFYVMDEPTRVARAVMEYMQEFSYEPLQVTTHDRPKTFWFTKSEVRSEVSRNEHAKV